MNKTYSKSKDASPHRYKYCLVPSPEGLSRKEAKWLAKYNKEKKEQREHIEKYQVDVIGYYLAFLNQDLKIEGLENLAGSKKFGASLPIRFEILVAKTKHALHNSRLRNFVNFDIKDESSGFLLCRLWVDGMGELGTLTLVMENENESKIEIGGVPLNYALKSKISKSDAKEELAAPAKNDISLPENIELTDIDALDFGENCKKYPGGYRDFSDDIAKEILRLIPEAWEDRRKGYLEGSWGPRFVAKRLSRDVSLISNHLRVLKKLGLRSVNGIKLPHREKKLPR